MNVAFDSLQNRLQMSKSHEDREVLTSSRKCSDDLQVSVVVGLVVEMTGTLCCGLTGLQLPEGRHHDVGG